MSTNAPQTISVKRKRNEAPVDSLVVERNDKRLKSAASIYIPADQGNPALKRKLDTETNPQLPPKSKTLQWRRIRVPHAPEIRKLPNAPPETPTRHFQVSHTDGLNVLVEHHLGSGQIDGTSNRKENVPSVKNDPQKPNPEASQPRKRPGAGTAIPSRPKLPLAPPSAQLGPSEETIAAFEKFSAQVENEESGPDNLRSPTRSPMKFKPRVPKLRYKDRHPDPSSAKKGKATDPNAMDIDGDEYVYDTYEIVMPDADGNIPEPEGTVGFIVLAEEDEDWWFGGDESDNEFDTDDEDENAEDYYANDYPEDEMSSEDEFDRGAYSYFHGEDDEEYDLEEGDADDAVPVIGQAVTATEKTRAGYWGRFGEKD